MSDYKYVPKDVESESKECFSTIDELNDIELYNRNGDTINQVPLPDNPFPDILKTPLFIGIVPEEGLIRTQQEKNFKPLVSTENKGLTEPRLKELSASENKISDEKIKEGGISNMSVGDFMKKIAGAYLDIINDLFTIHSIDDLKEIFIKDDRLIAIGILFIAISIFFIFFQGAAVENL